MVANEQLRAFGKKGKARLALEMDDGTPDHAAESAVVGGADGHRKPSAPGAGYGNPNTELSLDVVLATDRVVGNSIVETALFLRHAPDALPALDGDLGADRQVDDELACAEHSRPNHGQQPGRLPGSLGTGNRNAKLDVL